MEIEALIDHTLADHDLALAVASRVAEGWASRPQLIQAVLGEWLKQPIGVQSMITALGRRRLRNTLAGDPRLWRDVVHAWVDEHGVTPLADHVRAEWSNTENGEKFADRVTRSAPDVEALIDAAMRDDGLALAAASRVAQRWKHRPRLVEAVIGEWLKKPIGVKSINAALGRRNLRNTVMGDPRLYRELANAWVDENGVTPFADRIRDAWSQTQHGAKFAKAVTRSAPDVEALVDAAMRDDGLALAAASRVAKGWKHRPKLVEAVIGEWLKKPIGVKSINAALGRRRLRNAVMEDPKLCREIAYAWIAENGEAAPQEPSRGSRKSNRTNGSARTPLKPGQAAPETPVAGALDHRQLLRSGPSDAWLKAHHNAHAGETCIIAGNGPSLSGVSRDILGKVPTFGTNGCFLHFDPTYFVTVSLQFYKYKIEEMRDVRCVHKFIRNDLDEIITGAANESTLTCINPSEGMTVGGYAPVPLDFSFRPDRAVFIGGTVLFVCLQLAHWLGFETVVLVGVDHSFDIDEIRHGGVHKAFGAKDHIHFSDDYLPEGAMLHYDILAMERGYRLAKEAFEADGRTIVNATVGTKLDIFPQMDLNDALAGGRP
jgi:DNA-binding transcriptional LysR family regulator